MNIGKNIFLIFITFAVIVALAYYYGTSKYSVGEGLADSVSKELIVHYYVNNTNKLPLDIRLKTPADRVPFGRQQETTVTITNRSDQAVTYAYDSEVQPQSGTAGVLFLLGDSDERTIAPKAKEVLRVVYELDSAKAQTIDGTKSIYFRFR